MKGTQILAFSLLAGYSLILAGCAPIIPVLMYPAPPRPPDEVAIVSLWILREDGSREEYLELESLSLLTPGRLYCEFHVLILRAR